jgi:hypothetical protein
MTINSSNKRNRSSNDLKDESRPVKRSRSNAIVRLDTENARTYDALNYQANMGTMLNSYMEIFSHGFPLLSNDAIQDIIAYVSTLNDPLGRAKEGALKTMHGGHSATEVILYLTIQSFTLQRLGHTQIARSTYQQYRVLFIDYMNKEFVESAGIRANDSINLASAFATAAYYLVGEGGEANYLEADKFCIAAEYYLHRVKKMDKRQKFYSMLVKKYLALVELCRKAKYSDYRDGIKCLRHLVQGITETKLEPPASLHDFQSVLEFVDKAEETLHNYWKKKTNHISTILYHFYYRLIGNGIRLQVILANPDCDMKSRFEFSNLIVDDVVKHVLLSTYCPTPVQYLGLAARLHVMRGKSEEISEELKHYIRKDLYLLEIVSPKFGFVMNEYGDVMADLHSLVKITAITVGQPIPSVAPTDLLTSDGFTDECITTPLFSPGRRDSNVFLESIEDIVETKSSEKDTGPGVLLDFNDQEILNELLYGDIVSEETTGSQDLSKYFA